MRLPRPEIPQVAVMKVVGHVRSDVCGETGHEVPGLLWAIRQGIDDAQLVAWEESANVDLVHGGTQEPVVAVARHEVPLRAKIVIDSSNAEVAVLRDQSVAFEALAVYTVTTAPEYGALHLRPRTGWVIRHGL